MEMSDDCFMFASVILIDGKRRAMICLPLKMIISNKPSDVYMCVGGLLWCVCMALC